jgi:hypothetical protein
MKTKTNVNMKNKNSINQLAIAFASLLLCTVFYSCIDEEKRSKREREYIERKELIYKTEHCRFYCLERNGLEQCKVVICECDSGYNADVSVSW